MDALATLLAQLVSYRSITPDDNGCQGMMIDFLQSLGFQCQILDAPPVSNFYAQYGGGKPLLVFAGHTDVVPIGDPLLWQHDPFTLHQEGDQLFGRGVADMKGSLAAMMIAAERFVKQVPNPQGSLGFLITSGEEGDHFHLGTPHVMSKLKEQGICPDYCIVGEPSSTARIGDVIKIGRRGSLTGKLRLQGKQGHVAYPHLAENPIHRISAALNELVLTQWDTGNAHFPPTSLQFTHIHAGGQANNIIPGELLLDFNIRFSTEQTADKLKQAIEDCFERHGLQPLIDWRTNGEPFLTGKGELLAQCIQAIKHHTQQIPECSTTGGTSDGRFIAPYGVEVIELGPVNATIHQVNECVSLNDLHSLSSIYTNLCASLIG